MDSLLFYPELHAAVVHVPSVPQQPAPLAHAPSPFNVATFDVSLQ